MALLDRFRAQPRQKHPDPAVRLEFVAEIPIDERDVLAEIAREDDDARVRRAAVAKLMDPAALGPIAAADPDYGVREEAVSMLRDIALDAFEGVAESGSLAAVENLSDSKTLAVIAKTALREEIARRALDRISDAHAIGSIARHAQLEPVRLAAFQSLVDRGELMSVAINGEFKDTAVAAVERLAERADLEQIAARAKNKHAAKRARGLLRELDERAAAEAAANQPPAETFASPEPQPAIARRVDQDERAKREAAAAAEAAQAELRREREEQEAERLRREEAIREKAEDEKRKVAERRRARMLELVQEAETAAADEDLLSARRRFAVVQREWKYFGAGTDVDTDLVERHRTAESRVALREAAAREEDARVRREALGRVRQVLGRVEPLVEKADLSLKIGERALRDVRALLAEVPPLPSKRDYDDVMQRLKTLHAALTPKVQELRDVADWQRWANVGIQEQLCEKMEALREAEGPEQIVRQVRELQQQWKQAADVPRAQGEALWRRFKAAHDAVWARCETHFAEEAGKRAGSLARKVALCERVEALADSTNWIPTAEEIKRLQAEWKTIGPVTRGREKMIWERFRTACDRFFTRREADLAERKKMWAANLAKKEALCAEAEALADSTDWEATAAAIKRLQAQWKTIGPVKKNRSEAIWQRFRGACDRFFARYAQRHDVARAERIAAREGICAELEALAVVRLQSSVASPESSVASPESSVSSPESSVAGEVAAPSDLLAKVRALRSRWQQEIAARGVDRERAVALDARFNAAFSRILAAWPAAFAGSELDPQANRRRMDVLVRRVEDLAASIGAAPGVRADDAALSPTTRLAAMLKEALAANTIGGKVDENSRLRAAADEVRQAQASWSRIGSVPEEVRRPLAERFERACRRITERVGQAGRAAEARRDGLRAKG